MTQNNFVGRQQDVGKLKELVKNNALPFSQNPDEDTFRIVSIWGKAGVGKTSLLEYALKNEFVLLRNQLVLRTGKSKTPQSIASIIAGDFITGVDVPENSFKETLNCKGIIQSLDIAAIDRAVKNVKDKTKRSNIKNMLIKELGLLGVRYLNKQAESLLRESPYFNEHADQLIDSFQDRNPTWFATLTAGTGRPNRSFRLQVDVERELANSLVADIRNLLNGKKSKKRSLIIIIDDFEALEPLMERFLLQFFLRQAEKESFRTLLIILGRDELSWSSMGWDKFNHHKSDSIGLDVLDESDARNLLYKMGIYDDKEQNEILERSHKLPLLLDVLGQAYASGRQSKWVEDYFNRITYQMSAKQKQWLQALCFLDVRVDRDTIQVMLPDTNPSDVLEWFKSEASARISTKDGWQVDPIVRTIIQERVEQESIRQTIEFKEKAEQALKNHKRLIDNLEKK